MKKIFFFFLLVITIAINAQISHVTGETLLVNPTGRTLMIEKDDNDSWLTFHDPQNYWYSMGIDKSNSGSLSLNVGGDLNSSQFVMPSNGYIGIGLADPNVRLEVADEFRVRLTSYNPNRNIARIIPLGYSGVTGAMNWSIRGVYQYNNGIDNNSFGGDLDLIKSWNANTILATKTDGTSLGNVGIGTTNPDEKLTVKGKIHAEEVRVDLSVPPDYVFQKYYTGVSFLKSTYKMPTLKEVEKFTKKNHHLPEVPSAKKIKENGLNLEEMTALLLQKIEELTLYTIEQENKIENQKENIKEQKIINKNLEVRLLKLESLALKIGNK